MARRVVTVMLATALTAGVLSWFGQVIPPDLPAVETASPAAIPDALRGGLGRLPVSFTANQGRWDARASWVAEGREATAYFLDGGIRWALSPAGEGDGWALDQMLLGARPARPVASVPARGVMSYLGGDTSHAALPTATELTLEQAWPGVDVAWAGTGGQIEARYHIAPGADPGQIRVAWRGAQGLATTADGGLSVATPVRTFEESPPKAFQDVDGRRVPVEVSYAVDGDSYVFRLGSYDPARPLVIDPVVLLYSSFLGGNASDIGRGIAVDAAGNAYVVGDTFSAAPTFPETPGAFQPASGGSFDVFVAKINPSASALVYATFLGGASSEVAGGIAVDGAGNAYVAGTTSSTAATFPETPGAFQTVASGGADAFVAKLNPTGSALVYATYLGGAGSDFGDAIALDAAGNAYVAGSTGSTAATFPETAGAFQPENAGGLADGFVAKVNPTGSALVYASFLGGDSFDLARAIAVDGTGSAYLTGETSSTAATFPETAGVFQPANGLGAQDAFVAKVNPSGSALVYASFLGGDNIEEARGIAVDGAGNAYIAGGTFSTAATFPETPGVFQPNRALAFDAFVAKVNPTGSALVYASFLGGDGPEVAYAIAVDAAGHAYLTGSTLSSAATFPETAGALQPENAGSGDAFVAKVNPAGSGLVYATFLGGAANETGRGIAVDVTGNAYVTGDTGSPAASFPETPGVFQAQNGSGTEDAFVAKIGERASPTLSTTASPGGTVGSTTVTDTATLTGGLSPTGTVTFRLFSDATCMAQVFTSTNPVTNGQATSGSFAPTAAGTYRWTAAYSGDARNNPVVSTCGAPNESVTITKATPTLSTQASPGGILGTALRDVATVSGGFSPTGTVTFRLFSDSGCNAQVFTSTNALTGPTATSGWFTPAAAGTYWWRAQYGGDVNNNPVAAPCLAPNESAVIGPFQAPATTRTITGDFIGPLAVNAGESVLITAARVIGPLTVNPGGALTVVNSQISRGISANAPGYLSICGTQVSGPSPGPALVVSSAPVPIRIGDPAAGCAGNRFAGTVTLTSNSGLTFGANITSGNVTVNENGPGNIVVKANNVFQALACAGNAPAPTNAGQVNTAASKTGQCAAL
jgi:hypothetical protein